MTARVFNPEGEAPEPKLALPHPAQAWAARIRLRADALINAICHVTVRADIIAQGHVLTDHVCGMPVCDALEEVSDTLDDCLGAVNEILPCARLAVGCILPPGTPPFGGA